MLRFSNNLEATKSKFRAEIPGKWAEIPVRHESNLQFFVNLA